MSHRIAAKITGVAGHVPPKVMTNADLEKIVETNDEWIRDRVGIATRRIAAGEETVADMASAAAEKALKRVAEIFAKYPIA